jgi:hypothetical protein
MGNSAVFFTTSDEHGEYYVELQTPPDLKYVQSILALDGSVNGFVDEWERALDRPLEYRQILTNGERAAFLKDTQGHLYYQSSGYARPLSSGRSVNIERERVLLQAVKEQLGDGRPPIVFTEKKAKEKYEAAGFVGDGQNGKERNVRARDSEGEDEGDGPLAKLIDHSANLRGTNRYAGERLAVQLGSSHHGDHEIRRRAAHLDVAIHSEGRGMDREYGNEIGNAILWQMREAQTLQNILRVGRDGGGAVVVIDTAAYPDWLPIKGRIEVEPWPRSQCEVHSAWQELMADPAQLAAGVRTQHLVEHSLVSVSRRSVERALRSFEERGLLERRVDPNDRRAVRWHDTGLAGRAIRGAGTVNVNEQGPSGPTHPCSVMTFEVRDKSRYKTIWGNDANFTGQHIAFHSTSDGSDLPFPTKSEFRAWFRSDAGTAPHA